MFVVERLNKLGRPRIGSPESGWPVFTWTLIFLEDWRETYPRA